MTTIDYITELYDLAAAQWGMFTSAQAQKLGLRRNQITRMVKTGRIEPISYGVYPVSYTHLDVYKRQVEELFRRMVFNVIARNQDDHVKNISFLMDRTGCK